MRTSISFESVTKADFANSADALTALASSLAAHVNSVSARSSTIDVKLTSSDVALLGYDEALTNGRLRLLVRKHGALLRAHRAALHVVPCFADCCVNCDSIPGTACAHIAASGCCCTSPKVISSMTVLCLWWQRWDVWWLLRSLADDLEARVQQSMVQVLPAVGSIHQNTEV